ncbi:hypothetical protein TNCV_1299821 [Trichonephila clavipes]|nr:hypothetical protein TNCV_1299821 [Trichonephila clavipes]
MPCCLPDCTLRFAASSLRRRWNSPGSNPGLGKVDSAFHPFSGLRKEFQAYLETKTLRVSLQTYHLIGTSTHAAQCPMGRVHWDGHSRPWPS